MASKLVKRVQSIRELERAWSAIRKNARDSKSEDVQREVEKFAEDASSKVHSISWRLSRGKFKFEPAKGIPVPKIGADGQKSKTKFRPIVLAPLESRIVQRSILEALMSHKAMAEYAVTPYSFGGIRRQNGQELAAVPAAVSAALKAIEGGAQYVTTADIRAFFTRISKSVVRDIVSKAVHDDEFMSLFDAAVNVELANLADLREKAKLFPIEDIGVAQGNSLSPLLGNIILHDFDKSMNEGDCRCIRYIDDFIILAPTKPAAAARMRKAIKILRELGMELSPEKSSREPTSIQVSFEFLGIEFNNGFIRPSTKSHQRLLTQIDGTLQTSLTAFRAHRAGEVFPKSQSLISALRRVDGIVQGWGKHYRFCNDDVLVQRLDGLVKDRLRSYIGAYSDARDRSDESERQFLLGVEMLSSIKREPFLWPKIENRK